MSDAYEVKNAIDQLTKQITVASEALVRIASHLYANAIFPSDERWPSNPDTAPKLYSQNELNTALIQARTNFAERDRQISDRLLIALQKIRTKIDTLGYQSDMKWFKQTIDSIDEMSERAIRRAQESWVAEIHDQTSQFVMCSHGVVRTMCEKCEQEQQ